MSSNVGATEHCLLGKLLYEINMDKHADRKGQDRQVETEMDRKKDGHFSRRTK